jgi:hypothetical protein
VTRKLLFASAGAIALVVAMFALGAQQVARADTSSMDWDVVMSKGTSPGPGNDPVCPASGGAEINPGDCPTQTFNFTLDTSPTKPSNEQFFDEATQVWQTGPASANDLDGDTLVEPTDGFWQVGALRAWAAVPPACPAAPKPCLTVGTTIGQGSFTINTNAILSDLNFNNIDDAGGGDNDPSVTGQLPVCGNVSSTYTFTNVPFFLWASSINQANLVDTDKVKNDLFSWGEDCQGTSGTPNGIPDGIDCMPKELPRVQAALGLPIANFMGRGFGAAEIPILPPVFYEESQINFLVYNMVSVPEVQGYASFNVVNYPGGASDDPTDPTYDPLGQTVLTCPAFTVSVQVYGIGQDADYGQWNTAGYPNQWDFIHYGAVDKVTPAEINRQLLAGSTGSYNYYMFKSVNSDWDGDTIASTYDRCKIDPASGAATGGLYPDTDKDFLTGLCETLGAGNGEGTNPEDSLPVGWNTAPAWDSGQDVDGDGYINGNDNCPIIADRDLDTPTDGKINYQQDTDNDTVGDVCEIDLAATQGWDPNAYLIPGDGKGYPGQVVGDPVQVTAPGAHAEGKYVDRDNVCSDPFTVGSTETASDTGRWCAAYEAVGSGNNLLGRVVADSNDNGMPDLLDLPASQPNPIYPLAPASWPGIEWKDVKSDTDSDGHTDACEAFMGSDPLDPSSVPVYNHAGVTPWTPPPGDCNGDQKEDGTIGAAGVNECSDGIDNDGDTVLIDSADPDCQNGPGLDVNESDPFTGLDPDADRDGCSRSEESPGAKSTAPYAPGSTSATTVAGTVAFQDSAWYDFYDVPVPSLKGGPGATYNGAVGTPDVLAVNSYSACRAGDACYENDVNGNTVRDGLEYDRSPSTVPNKPYDAGPPNGAIGTPDVLAVNAQSALKCALGKHGW